jgi:histidinol phosphatase-like PHP family hydrolase
MQMKLQSFYFLIIIACLLILSQFVSSQPNKPIYQQKRDSLFAFIKSQKFPLIDYHVHIKGGLTIEAVLEKSKRMGIVCGIAPNCGLNFPITNDSLLLDYFNKMRNYPVFLGMQAEGREWTKAFSKEAIVKFDYVFTDALTFTDDNGKRMRIWLKEEVEIKDAQAFMDMYVKRILDVINTEPIDIFVNPTFLPEVIAPRYDELWTNERMQKVIGAAVKRNIAIEINDRYKIPGAKFIKLAKKSGVKFSFGTNNADTNFGDFSYCKEMIKECNLFYSDIFQPKCLKEYLSKEK